MKYNVDNLQKIKNDIEKINDLASALNDMINRSIIIKNELEPLEQLLSTPERTDKDIVRHAQLIKEYADLYADDPSDKLAKFCTKLSVNLYADYKRTVGIIKAD